MPSPFPGMGPFLENSGRWADFHHRFVNYCCEAIADKLPDAYGVWIEERSWPKVLPDLLEDPVEQFIQIVKLPEQLPVTVLELLSPTHKEETGRSEFAMNRHAFLRNRVNVVELDLLIGGQRLPMGGTLPPGHFFAIVARGRGGGSADVYPWTVRDRLPVLPVPLSAPDPDIRVDLSAVFATTFERGRYARTIRYDDPLKLPLGDDDRAWIRERLNAAHPGPPTPG